MLCSGGTTFPSSDQVNRETKRITLQEDKMVVWRALRGTLVQNYHAVGAELKRITAEHNDGAR